MKNASARVAAKPICRSRFPSGNLSRPSGISSAPPDGAFMTARILVVDDIPANLKLLEARLSAEYFDVLTANDGAEALAVCERAECDIVLLDVMMPGLDGFEVCRKLKSNPRTHHIPVVMVRLSISRRIACAGSKP